MFMLRKNSNTIPSEKQKIGANRNCEGQYELV